MAETTERTETSKKGISDPFKEFKIVGFRERRRLAEMVKEIYGSRKAEQICGFD